MKFRVLAADAVGDKGRVCHHDIAARHAGIVKPFESRVCCVGAVIGRDQRNAGQPCRRKRAPGGRAAAHMDDVDIFASDNVM